MNELRSRAVKAIKKRPVLYNVCVAIINGSNAKISAARKKAARVIQAARVFQKKLWDEQLIRSAEQNEQLVLAAEQPEPMLIGSKPQGRKVVMLVVSDLRIDPRVEREARVLALSGFNVTVICPDPTYGKGPKCKLDWGPNVAIEFIHWTASSFMAEPPGYMAGGLFKAAIKHRPFAFHAHDLSTAYAGLAAARKTGAHLVVDFHEWSSENVFYEESKLAWMPYPDIKKAPLAALEARCLKEASAVITVCDSIADAMAAELGDGRRPVVIRNIPSLKLEPTRAYRPLKEQLGLPSDSFVLLWQGGTGPTRLIEPIIEALAFALRCTLVVRGPSLDLFGEAYTAIAKRIGAEKRLILLPPVPSRDVVAAARGADAGIWSLPNLCRNFSMALPNKIFEYLASGLPLLVADYPEARKIAVGLGAGLTFDPYDPKSIAAAINQMIDDPQRAKLMRDAVPAALTTLDAGNEWAKLVDVYRSLPGT